MPLRLDLQNIPFGDQIQEAAQTLVDREFDPQHVLDTAACDAVIGLTIKDALTSLPKKEGPKENPTKFALMDAFIAVETLRKLYVVVTGELQADMEYKLSIKQDPDAPRNSDWRRSLHTDGDSGPSESEIRNSARHPDGVDQTAADRSIHQDAIRNDRRVAESACEGMEANRNEVRQDEEDSLNEKLPPLPKFEGLPATVVYPKAIRYFVDAVLKMSKGFPLHRAPRLQPLLQAQALQPKDLAEFITEIAIAADQLKYHEDGRRDQF